MEAALLSQKGRGGTGQSPVVLRWFSYTYAPKRVRKTGVHGGDTKGPVAVARAVAPRQAEGSEPGVGPCTCCRSFLRE